LGQASHSECYDTKAVGYYSHAEGRNTVAQGTAAHAEGSGTKANGNYSHAGGLGTRALVDYQTAIGKYNAETDALFVVGNGTADAARSNAFEVYENGDVKIGALKLAPTSWTDEDGKTIEYSEIYTNVIKTNTGKMMFYVMPGSEDGAVWTDKDINMGYHKITSLTEPKSSDDAATKAYVDNLISGGTEDPNTIEGLNCLLYVQYS
jgi:hypothetical protein